MELSYRLNNIDPKASHIVSLVKYHSVIDIMESIRKGVSWEDFYKVQKEMQVGVDQMRELLHLTKPDMQLNTLSFNASDRFWMIVHLYNIGYNVKKGMQSFIDWMKKKYITEDTPLELCQMTFMNRQLEMELVRELVTTLKQDQERNRKDGKQDLN